MKKLTITLLFIIVFLVIGLVYLDLSRKFDKIRQAQNDNVELTLMHNEKINILIESQQKVIDILKGVEK